MTSRRAIVVGAGCAGLCAALGLLKEAGEWKVSVFEARNEVDRYEKGWVTMFPNGSRALRWLGVDVDELAKKEGAVIKQLGIGGARVSAASNEDEPTYALKLASFIPLLTKLVKERGGEIRFNQRVSSFAKKGQQVVVTFDNGQAVEADLLIGADGLHSSVRAHLNPDEECLRKLDQLNVRGWSTCKPTMPLPPPEVLYFSNGRRLAFGYVPSPDGQIWFIANWQPDEADEAQTDLRARLAELCSDDPEVALAKELFASDQTTLTGPWQFYDIPQVPNWHDGSSIVLVGSAAHGVASNTGTGCSFAVEDAVVLARCISKSSSLAEALASYESKRRARCEAFTKQGAQFALYKPTSPLRIWLKKTLLPIAFRIVTLFISPAAWVYDYRAEDA